MTDNITTIEKDFFLKVIEDEKAKIAQYEENIMDERAELFHNLKRADDVHDVYMYIKNTTAYIEEQLRMIDISKDCIIGIYKNM